MEDQEFLTVNTNYKIKQGSNLQSANKKQNPSSSYKVICEDQWSNQSMHNLLRGCTAPKNVAIFFITL